MLAAPDATVEFERLAVHGSCVSVAHAAVVIP